ncbi:predicted protein [Streptomyces viridosporus ATCC 14672]|uniref:Predicted protein n=1 Tax=Streptomyces viridosporus (strain ATCC 14672 / DSM 40746 / JCM 4963 / KCTC 9882 / NRRL B-12104 / FH 1290) TaxID=566461 RepID=D6AA44_STRV1|nr:predicted protein [Streptomyces viridosporus ATCC 14672]
MAGGLSVSGEAGKSRLAQHARTPPVPVAPKGDRQHPAPGRRPLRPQERTDPVLGAEEPGRAVLHPDLRLLGQPDRSPLRAASAVHRRQLPPPQPHRADPRPARLLRRRNKNAHPPDVPAAQRRERVRIRGEKGIRWDGRALLPVS